MSSTFHLQIHGQGASLGHWMGGPRRAVREEARWNCPETTRAVSVSTLQAGVVSDGESHHMFCDWNEEA